MDARAVAAADAVERQFAAYNAHDLVGFVACYAEDVVILDADGAETTRGRTAMVDEYRPWFAEQPDLDAEIVQRMRVGPFVVDEELISGVSGGDVRAIAIYRIDATGLIDRVQFLQAPA